MELYVVFLTLIPTINRADLVHGKHVVACSVATCPFYSYKPNTHTHTYTSPKPSSLNLDLQRANKTHTHRFLMLQATSKHLMVHFIANEGSVACLVSVLYRRPYSELRFNVSSRVTQQTSAVM